MRKFVAGPVFDYKKLLEEQKSVAETVLASPGFHEKMGLLVNKVMEDNLTDVEFYESQNLEGMALKDSQVLKYFTGGVRGKDPLQYSISKRNLKEHIDDIIKIVNKYKNDDGTLVDWLNKACDIGGDVTFGKLKKSLETFDEHIGAFAADRVAGRTKAEGGGKRKRGKSKRRKSKNRTKRRKSSKRSRKRRRR